jgi:hypothetical protein
MADNRGFAVQTNKQGMKEGRKRKKGMKEREGKKRYFDKFICLGLKISIFLLFSFRIALPF